MKVLLRLILASLLLASCGQVAKNPTQSDISSPTAEPAVSPERAPQVEVPAEKTETTETQGPSAPLALPDSPAKTEGSTTAEPTAVTPRSAGTAAVSTWQARVTYAEPQAGIWRAGQYADADVGQSVFAGDLMTTGKNGLMEVLLKAPGMPGTVIKMSPNSQFYLDPEVLDSQGKTTIEHLAGQIVLKVEKLSANTSLDVRTRQSVIGVRGTEFKVWEAPTLDLLISVTEGAVAATQSGQKEVRIPSGTAAYKAPEETFATVSPGVSRLTAFETKWIDTVLSELEVLALPKLTFMGQKWESRLQAFDKALKALQAQSALLGEWKADVKAGKKLSSEVLLRRQKVVSPLILNLKKVLFFLERDAAWVKSLEAYPQILAAHQALAQKAQNRDFLRDLSLARLLLGEYKLLLVDSPMGDLMDDDFFGEDLF